MNILILYSGGLDSAIMKRYAEVKYPDANIELLYVNLGHDYAFKEMATLDSSVEVMPLTLPSAQNPVGKDGSSSGNIIIPGRNLLLAVVGACLKQPDQVWLGALMGEIHEGSTDKNCTFRDKLNDVLGYVFSPFDTIPKVVFPFVDADMGKLEITQWALANGFTKEQLMSTSSCLTGEPGNCGTCVVCARRWGIFNQLGFDETYNRHPVLAVDAPIEMYMEMVRGEMGQECHYDAYRRREIVPALMKFFDAADLQTLYNILETKLPTK
jgi:7-cyano-7-deazaguanine synthase in queuosine biosynthesis